MDTRQRFLIASIVLFVASLGISLPWKLIWGMAMNPIALIFVVAGFTAPTFSFFRIDVTLVGALALFISWGLLGFEMSGPALIAGSIAVIAALVLTIAVANTPSATSSDVLGNLLWLAAPIAACYAGITCIPRISRRS
ncbi:MAG TPA: hypothetical protein VME45_10505 [Stellaceae bacterium]|nr:hypothetical protein [Stellaceae bacterium]